MSLPASQQRVLDAIENTLNKREPRLASMFAMFARLTSHEAVPRLESLDTRPWWSPRRYRLRAHLRALVLIPVAAALVVTAVVLGMNQSRLPCSSPVVVRGPLTEQTHARTCPTVPEARILGQVP